MLIIGGVLGDVENVTQIRCLLEFRSYYYYSTTRVGNMMKFLYYY